MGDQDRSSTADKQGNGQGKEQLPTNMNPKIMSAFLLTGDLKVGFKK